MEINLAELLRSHRLHITPIRLSVLTVFYKKNTCLSHEDIQRALQHRLDRVSVYRTLRIFVKKGILNCIPTSGNSNMYALHDFGSTDGQTVQHALFICERCGMVYPLKVADIRVTELPGNFTVKQFDIVMNGKCGDCS